MKAVITLLLTIPLVFSAERVCYRASARVDFADGEPVSFKARGREQTCETEDFGCGAVRKFARSIRLTSGETEETGYRSRTWRTLDAGCTPPGICQRIVGTDTGAGCRYADYMWTRYVPMSCNETNDYDAEKFRQRVRMYYACCNSDKCLDPSNTVAVSNSDLNGTCTKNEALSEYLSQLHVCWNKVNLAYRRYFVCNSEGPNLVTFREECSDSVYDEYDRTRAASTARGNACYYRPTCSAELQRLITAFGECACDKAKANNYTGAAIGSLIESIWTDFCPDLEISCAGDSRRLWLRRRRRRRRIKFRIKRKIADITDGIKTAIRTKIAAYLRREDSTDDITVTVTAASDDGSTRRRLLTADPETESDVTADVLGDDAFDDEIAAASCDSSGLTTALGDTAGGTATSISCDSENAYDTVSGGDDVTTTSSPETTVKEGDDAMRMIYVFAIFIGLMAYLME